MSAEEVAVRERLIGALAQCAPAAYMDNPEFHAAVHQLAAMLPAMVLGLAVECQRQAAPVFVIDAVRWPNGVPEIIPPSERVARPIEPGDR